MRLFIALLAFANDARLQDEVKVGIVVGALVFGLLGYTLLGFGPRDVLAPPSR